MLVLCKTPSAPVKLRKVKPVPSRAWLEWGQIQGRKAEFWSLQESCRGVSSKVVQGVRSYRYKDTQWVKKGSAAGHRAETQDKKKSQEISSVGMSKKLLNKSILSCSLFWDIIPTTPPKFSIKPYYKYLLCDWFFREIKADTKETGSRDKI